MVKELLELLSDINNRFKNTEENLRASALSLDLLSYTVNLEDTEWYTQDKIKQVDVDLRCDGAITLYVDLSYFDISKTMCLFYTYNNSNLLYLTKEDLVDYDLICADEVTIKGVPVFYVVVSYIDKSITDFLYIDMGSYGLSLGKRIKFDISVTGGKHHFETLGDDMATYTMTLDTLQKFSDCRVRCNKVALMYKDYDIIKNNNIEFRDINEYIIGVAACTDNGKEQVIEICKYWSNKKDTLYALSIYFLLADRYSVDDFVEWLDDISNLLKGQNLMKFICGRIEISLYKSDNGEMGYVFANYMQRLSLLKFYNKIDGSIFEVL